VDIAHVCLILDEVRGIAPSCRCRDTRRRRASEAGRLPISSTAFSARLPTDHAVVIRPRRVLRELLEERLTRVGGVRAMERRDDAEQPREERDADKGAPRENTV